MSEEFSVYWNFGGRNLTLQSILRDFSDLPTDVGNTVPGPHLANAYVRKLLLASAANNLETQMALEAQLLSQCAASRDGRECIQTIFDKRKPEFD